MRKASLPERRKSQRRGVAVRVMLRDHRPPMHAMTRNVSLGGMYLMTATRKLNTTDATTAEIEIDRRGEHWSQPLPVRVVWNDHMSAGIMFDDLSKKDVDMLRELLADGAPLPAKRRHQRVRP
jgi:hypothetical protein